jgi:hypothetical protein
MSYKTIAIVISDEVGDKEALQAAITFADREGGHLDVYCLGIDLGARPSSGRFGANGGSETGRHVCRS